MSRLSAYSSVQHQTIKLTDHMFTHTQGRNASTNAFQVAWIKGGEDYALRLIVGSRCRDDLAFTIAQHRMAIRDVLRQASLRVSWIKMYDGGQMYEWQAHLVP